MTIELAATAWTFAANGHRASVTLIDGTYPDVRSIVGTGDEPALFAINPQYFRDTLSSHGSEVVTVSRAGDDAHAPLFFIAHDGTRHVVMPMVVPSPSGAWKRREDAAPVAERQPEAVADEQTTCPRCDVSRDLADGGSCHACTAELARLSEPDAAAGTIAHDAPTCATCDAPAAPADTFCAECGSPFGEPAPVAVVRPVATPYALASYSAKNRERILAQCPHASDVRGFHAWLKAGRAVRKGEKGSKIVAPVMGQSDGSPKVVNIKPAYVFDVSQMDERTQRAAA